MCALLGWIIIGAIAGWLASMVMGTNKNQGLLLDIVVGIIGSFIGGFIFNALGIIDDDNTGVIGSLIVAFVGAVIFLAIWKQVRKAV